MLNIKQIPTGEIQENCYLIYNDTSLIVVDPGNDAEVIKETIKNTGCTPEAILITHAHYDHIGAVDAIRDAYNIPVYISPIEKDWLGDPMLNLSGLGRHDDMDNVVIRDAEHLFTNYDKYSIGDMTFTVVPTPGHSPGSVSFIFDDFIVSGDAIFRGSVGRSDLPFSNGEALLKGIREELFTQPDDKRIYPGHGPVTSVGREKTTNPFFV